MILLWVGMLVVSGLGIALMPEFRPIIPDLQLRLVVDPEISRPVSLVTVAGRLHTPAVARVIRIARAIDWPGEPDAIPAAS